MIICGDLGGKPCELLCDRRCPRSGLLGKGLSPSSAHLACAPMVALVESRNENEKLREQVKTIEAKGRGNGMCMDVAPSSIAVCAAPSPDGILRTPWCHLPKGHSGEHVCGEHRWMQLRDLVVHLERRNAQLLMESLEARKLRAEVARLKAELIEKVGLHLADEDTHKREVAHWQRMEAAAKAHRSYYKKHIRECGIKAMFEQAEMILSGLGPDGREVKP